MKLAIINLTRGGMSGGYQKYLRNIIPRLASHPDMDAILCASPASLNIKNWFKPLSNVTFINCRTYHFSGYITDSELIRQIKIFSPDVIFIPTERCFLNYTGVPIINMIQNMEPFVSCIDGNPFGEQFRILIQRMDAKRAIKKSYHIIAISNFVRDFLVQHWKVPTNKIGLVYHGIGLPENKNLRRPDTISEEWGSNFLFTSGSIRPARGLEDILYALNHLINKSVNISGLVIAGETSSGMRKYREKLERWIQNHDLPSKICWAQSLNEEEMAWCYQNCRAFIMTSRVESFGMIAGEAMAHGCICIAADNPCLPEIFNDVAVYYPPKDCKALANTIQTVLSWDNNQRNEVSQRSKTRAAQFSWDITAEKTVSELAKAVEGFRSNK